jgi:hypothetical protein
MSRAVFQSTLGGSTTLDAEQTADTKTLVIPAADGTLVYTDDAGVASFDDISLTGAVIAGAWDGDTIDVAHGGTGAVTLTGYVKGAGTTALTASATIPNSDITGLGTMSTQNANAVAITGGTISGLGTPLAVPSGGSGAATLTGYVKGNGTSAMTASATIPNTDITGLGTMSTQNSDAVTITGGTANGLTIGGSTPAAVTATTLRVNSTVSLAGDTGVAGQVLTSNGGSAPTWESVAGVGTVTSVDGSGGTTGLSLTGGPITASGTLTLGGTLAVANGGTGSTTAPDALTALGAYPASNPSGFGTGTVTSVTGTAPVVSSGGNTPAISMAAANTTTDGYLTSTDWNTFNGKGAGTVTSVGGTGTVNGLTLTGTVTTSGDLTLGGTLDLASPPAIGGTTPAAGAFTTLTMNGGAISPQTGFKNRIINGGMTIDQRNAGASVTPTVDAQYGSCDRWSYFLSQASKFSVQQNAGAVTPPVGFSNYLGVTSLSAYSVLSGDSFNVLQKIEGFNTSDFAWGTANAQTVSLSFWVRSSLTGTFGGAITNGSFNRSYPFTYTISAANTWEQKTVTIAGDTSGTWATNNAIGVVVQFGLGAGATRSGTAGAWAGSYFASATGATSVVGTNGATFYITGVQLEKSSTATPFEFRSIGTELALCQRYYYKITNTTNPITLAGFAGSTVTSSVSNQLPVPMRVAPSAVEQTGTASNYRVVGGGATTTVCSAVPAFSSATTETTRTNFTVASGLVAYNASIGSPASGVTAFLAWSAEL